MAKYKVGDKVKVRSDLSSIHGASKMMIELWAGKVVTISKVFADEPLLNEWEADYHIAEDTIFPNVKFIWGDEMFEGLAETEAISNLIAAIFGTPMNGSENKCE